MPLVAEHRVPAARAVRDIVARRIEVTPVQVLRAAHDVVRPARARVTVELETLDALGPAASQRDTGEWARPDTQLRDRRPAERAEEGRPGGRRWEGGHARRPLCLRLFLVLALEPDEDAAAAGDRVRRLVH